MRSNIPIMAKDPVYKTTGKRTVTYPNKNNPDTRERVVLSKRFSKNAGVVGNLMAKYLGRKTNAVAIMAKAASASHAMPTNALSPNTEPFSPTQLFCGKIGQ